ncbi:MAG: hypothetical protein QW548_00040 [Candidatus Aenigmatarchaeota archaeon]
MAMGQNQCDPRKRMSTPDAAAGRREIETIKKYAETHNMLYFIEELSQKGVVDGSSADSARNLINRRKGNGMTPEDFFDEAFALFSSSLGGKPIAKVNEVAEEHLGSAEPGLRCCSAWREYVTGLCMLKRKDEVYTKEPHNELYQIWRDAAISNDYANPTTKS